jgi:hypothetical protein
MSAVGTALIGVTGLTPNGETFEGLMLDGEDPRITPFVGQFTDGPFKGQHYTQAAFDIAHTIEEVTDRGRFIEAAPRRLQ